MTLNDLKPGQTGIIKKLKVQGEIRHRIIDMGIIPGTTVMMKKSSPFGDPIEIKIRGYKLSIRKSEALNIIIEPVKADKYA